MGNSDSREKKDSERERESNTS